MSTAKALIPVRIFLTLFVSLAAATAPVFAEEEPKWYEVEVIVFARTTPNLEAEEWPKNPGQPAVTGAAEVLPVGDLVHAPENGLPPIFQALPHEAMQLADIAEKLNASPDFNVLNHTAWVQPTLKNQAAVPVYLSDTEVPYLYQEAPLAPTLTETSLPESQMLLEMAGAGAIGVPTAGQTDTAGVVDGGMPNPAPIVPKGPPQHRLYGTVVLKLSRYLHFGVDLMYRPVEAKAAERTVQEQEPAFPMAGEVSPALEAIEPVLPDLLAKGDPGITVGYRLNESRRVRTGELYYYDHPLFGVIVQVLTVEAPMDRRMEELQVPGEGGA